MMDDDDHNDAEDDHEVVMVRVFHSRFRSLRAGNADTSALVRDCASKGSAPLDKLSS